MIKLLRFIPLSARRYGVHADAVASLAASPEASLAATSVASAAIYLAAFPEGEEG